MSAKIRLAEGGGGEATAKLIKNLFQPHFSHPELFKGNDAALLPSPAGRLAVTTDSFVVTPWRFRGGDIGKLAICGTVNDLTMMGAAPLGLTAAFIIEEGFEVESLEQIACSMGETASQAGVAVVAGDTKVVNRGAADGIFITTTGVGAVAPGIMLGGELAQTGDQVIVTGSIGDHGAAILLARGELGISGQLASDVAPLNHFLLPITRRFGEAIRVMRDPTRGGLATTLNEIARQSRVSIRILEPQIPIKPEIRGISDLLGLDPLYLANEGKAIMICSADIAGDLIALLRLNKLGREAAIIGEVGANNPGLVSLKNAMGGERIIPLGSGEQLPRIC